MTPDVGEESARKFEVELYDDERDEVLALPPGPLCMACAHQLCPCCPRPWCDRLIGEDPDTCWELDTCCDGACKVLWDDWLEWRKECRAVEEAEVGLSMLTVAEGPWLPARVRRERELPCFWYPSPVYANAPAVVELMARVSSWQRESGCVPDGLIGGHSWSKRDFELCALAAALDVALAMAGLHDSWQAIWLRARRTEPLPDPAPHPRTVVREQRAEQRELMAAYVKFAQAEPYPETRAGWLAREAEARERWPSIAEMFSDWGVDAFHTQEGTGDGDERSTRDG